MDKKTSTIMNEKAAQYANRTSYVAPNADEMDAETLIRNMRFMSFAAGFREGFEAAKSDGKEGLYLICSDDSGHDYIIPESKWDEFDRWVNDIYETGDYSLDFGALRIDGSFRIRSFTMGTENKGLDKE